MGIIDEEFLPYAKQAEAPIMHIQKELERNIHSDNLQEVKQYAADMLAHRSYVVGCLCKCNEFLANAHEEYLPSKAEGGTELDRKSKVASHISYVQYWVDLCEGIIKTIDLRVSYAQSLLSFEKEYVKRIGEEHG